jgi:hypothetical protein
VRRPISIRSRDPTRLSRLERSAALDGRSSVWTADRASDYERFSHACLAADSKEVREARV